MPSSVFFKAALLSANATRFELSPVEINTLNIERTFIDKIMSVKRHAICGTLDRKVRHIYDVVRLFQMPEIQSFLAETEELKRLVRLRKTPTLSTLAAGTSLLNTTQPAHTTSPHGSPTLMTASGPSMKLCIFGQTCKKSRR